VAAPTFRIEPVSCADDLRAAAELFAAYAASLDVDLAYQDFQSELAALPGKYAPPAGALLLARDDGGAAIGCVGVRALEAGCCEMKRLFVSPGGRGLGLGKALAAAVIEAAKGLGYREIRLDTLPTMTRALELYRRLGFTPVAPYYDTPIAGTVFLARAL
jgi:ribosomal protein S18 acetylase RimI-like enzyme